MKIKYLLPFLLTMIYNLTFAQDYKESIVNEKSNGGTVTLEPDGMLVVKLTSMTSNGYVWVAKYSEKGVISDVTDDGELEYATQKGIVAPGAPRTQVFRFVGNSVGKGNLVFTYERPWEKTKGVVKTINLKIESKGKFKGTYVKKEKRAYVKPDPSTIAVKGLPATLNYVDLGWVTPVKDQGQFGTCWAFGSTAVLEAKIKHQVGHDVDFSEQWMNSCNPWGMNGVNGGFWAYPMYIDYIVPGDTQAGAVYETDVPYTGAEGGCSAPYVHHEKVTGWGYCDGINDTPWPATTHQATTAQLKMALYQHGPIGTCIDDRWPNYTTGVWKGYSSTTNHIVTIVGYDDVEGCFLVKNSWGTGWGMGGYIKIAYGASAIGTLASYVSLNDSPINGTPPVAEANGPYRGTVGTPVQLSSAGSHATGTSIVNYLWRFIDGSTITGANPTYTPTIAGYNNIELEVKDGNGWVGGDMAKFVVASNLPLTPYTGTPVTLPGRIECEDFDNGGFLVAYNDRDAGNLNGAYRTGDVDLEKCTDVGEGFDLGSTGPGEWVKYTVNIPTGVYNINFRAAFGWDLNAGVSLFLGNDSLCSVRTPITGDWQKFQTVTVSNVAVNGGDNKVLTLKFWGVGVVNECGNYNWIEFVPTSNKVPLVNIHGPYSGVKGQSVSFSSAGTSDPDGSITSYLWSFGDGASSTLQNPTHVYESSWDFNVILQVIDNGKASKIVNTTAAISNGETYGPYYGVNRKIPGRIELEQYNYGGQHIAYFDNSRGSFGGAYRDDDVDISATPDDGGGYYVGGTGVGEWINYTVDVTAGTYELRARVAHPYPNGEKVEVYLDDVFVGAATMVKTATWNSFQTVVVPNITVTGGNNRKMTIKFTGDSNDYGNVNWIEFVQTGNSCPIGVLNVPNTGRIGQPISFSALGSTDNGSIASYQWSFGDGSTATTTTPTTQHVYTAAGIYRIGLIVTDNQGASSITLSKVEIVDLPNPWSTSDIGEVKLFGSATFTNGVFTIKGSGYDINKAYDEFRYVYQQKTGDFQIISRVTGQQTTNMWAKTGLMIRESLDDNAKHAMIVKTLSNGVLFQAREVTDGLTSYETGVTASLPVWLKFVRSGNQFSGYISTDAVNWIQVNASKTIPMNQTVYVGMVVGACDASAYSISTIDNVTISNVELGDTQAPTAPSNLAASNIAQTSLSLTWSASTDNVGVSGYDVYQGSTLIGSSAATTYNVTGLTANTQYSFTVKAKDAAGNISPVSNTVTVTTLGVVPANLALNKPTTCSANNIQSPANATDGSLTTRWESAFADNQFLQVDLLAVYSVNRFVISWEGAYASGYTIKVSTDGTNWTNAYATTTGDGAIDDISVTPLNARYIQLYCTARATGWGNSVLEFEVYGSGVDTQAPVVPANLAASNISATGCTLTWTASTDNVGVTGYDVYRGTTLVTTVTSTSVTISGLTTATAYSFTVKAKDAAGNVSGASNVVNITTLDNIAPSAPINLAASVVEQTLVSLTWTASTDNVGVTGYDIFLGGTLKGSSTTASYNVTGLIPGTTYSVTVKAKDAAGNISSASVALSVTTLVIPSYCNVNFNSTWEWIAGVSIGSFTNTSVAAGYTDFTNKTINLAPGASVSVTLTPGNSYTEYWRVYIDYNKDGDFTDANEIAFFSTGAGVRTGSFVVPTGLSGSTRMRVAMRSGSYADPCASSGYGEVEDYTVNFNGLGAAMDINTAKDAGILHVFPNPVTNGILNVETNFESYTLTITDLSGKNLLTQKCHSFITSLNISMLQKGVFILTVQHEGEKVSANIIVQ